MSDNDSFTETSSTSWFSRLGNSFKGIGTGIALFAAATALMYWNEGRAVRTGDAIAEAQTATVLLPSIDRVDPAFEGKTVYAKGRAVTADTLTDPSFGITVNAIKLIREVEYYQWIEESKTEKRQKLGGGEETVTTYRYLTKWVKQPVDSNRFKRPIGHTNVSHVNVKKDSWTAPNVTFGAYRLPDFLKNSIGGQKPVQISLTDAQRMALQKAFKPASPVGGSEQSLTDAAIQYAVSMVHSQENTLYLGENPGAPQVGDVRLSFFEIPSSDVSLIAKISGDTFTPFRASNGNSFSKLSTGIHDMNAMFDDAKSDNEFMTWILRVAGVVLCISGISLVVAPIQVFASVIPLLGSIIGAGTGLVSSLIGLAWSCIVIAIAWIRFRPVLGLSLLAAALLLLVFLFIRGRKRKKEAAA